MTQLVDINKIGVRNWHHVSRSFRASNFFAFESENLEKKKIHLYKEISLISGPIHKL
jgi:hypothetical protein